MPPQQALLGRCLRELKTPAQGRRAALVQAMLVVEDGVRSIEASAGQALLVVELAPGTTQHRVVLGRQASGGHTLDHGFFSVVACSSSMLSNSARKLPAPKPSSPLRWMSS